jgi:hypothetical protein
MTGLERGYRRLLRAYPAWYRRERGEEMLDTLLAAAPHGRTWPSLRDSGALILGGLRVRAGQNRRLTTRANLRLAALFGVALWLTGQAADNLALAGLGWLHGIQPTQHFAFVALRALLILAAVGAACFAPRPVVAAVSLIAIGAIVLIAVNTYAYLWWMFGEPVMLAVLALLAGGKERMPRHWLWLLGVELAVQTLIWFMIQPLFSLFVAMNDLPWVVLAAVVLWAVVDARPAIAVGVCAAMQVPFVIGGYGIQFGFDTQFGAGHEFFWPLACVLALVMTLRVRRQAAL